MIDYINVWTVLGAVSIVALVVSGKKRNAIWGGLTFGIFVGLIILIVKYFTGSVLDWIVIVKSAIVGSLIGFGAEVLSMLVSKLKNRRKY